jgi:hypothetical protein
VTNNAPPFTVSFELTTEDLVDYLRVAQKGLNSVGIAAGVIGILYGAYLAWTGSVTLGAVLGGMGAFMFLVSATRHADRLRARSAGKRIIGTQSTFTIDESGIAASTAGGTGHAPWASVDNIVESPRVVVLRRGRATKIWLPKRALGSAEESESLLRFVRAHVGATGG